MRWKNIRNLHASVHPVDAKIKRTSWSPSSWVWMKATRNQGYGEPTIKDETTTYLGCCLFRGVDGGTKKYQNHRKWQYNLVVHQTQKKEYQSKEKPQGKRKEWKTKKTCDNCKKTWHTTNGCFYLKGFPPSVPLHGVFPRLDVKSTRKTKKGRQAKGITLSLPLEAIQKP